MRHFIDIVEAELPMDKASRMARAEAMGFTIAAYHGTGAKFNEFSLDKGKPSPIGGYAPMFADAKAEAQGYADERAAEGGKVHLLHVLLRIRKALPVDIRQRSGVITPAEYKAICGQDFEPGQYVKNPTGYAALRELESTIGWADQRALWTKIYAKLASLGYDALAYVDVPGDHHNGRYTKFVVFDPKNIRSIRARFDPAKTDSGKLMD